MVEKKMADNQKYDAAERLKTIMRMRTAAKEATVTHKTSEERDLEIQGFRDGEIRGHSVTILGSGCVRGDIHAQTVVIQGTFSGNIYASRIHVLSSAFVEGELHYHALAVHPGAQMEAECIPSAANHTKIAV